MERVVSAREMVAILAKYAVKVQAANFSKATNQLFICRHYVLFRAQGYLAQEVAVGGQERVRGGGLSLRELPRINATEASSEEDEGRIISRYELDHRRRWRRRRRDQNSIIEFLSWALRGGKKGRGGGRSSPMS